MSSGYVSYLHTHYDGVYVSVHIGVGFGVACSEQ